MSNQDMNDLLTKAAARYAQIVKVIGQEAQAALLVEPNALLEVLAFFKTDESYQFNMLRNLTAVDYLEYLEVVYHLYSLPRRQAITVKTRIDIELSEVPSVTSLWPSADFQEREVYDLFGVKFIGHPDLRRILLPSEFPGHPLRKTYGTDNAGKRGNQ